MTLNHAMAPQIGAAITYKRKEESCKAKVLARIPKGLSVKEAAQLIEPARKAMLDEKANLFFDPQKKCGKALWLIQKITKKPQIANAYYLCDSSNLSGDAEI